MGVPMITRAPDPQQTPFRVSPSHARILRAVNRYERLTAAQATRILFSEGSLTYAQKKLRELFLHGYVRRKTTGRDEPRGSGALVYTLDRRGRAYLLSSGIAVPGRLRQSEEEGRSAAFLRHGIAVVDVLILCDLLCRADDRFAVARMIGERELRGCAVTVIMPDGRSRGVTMDAWVDLHIGGAEQMCLGFEVDNGTEFQTAWREKIRALLAMDTGPYREAFGVDTLTIVVVARDGPRARQLRQWTETELAEQGADRRRDLFRFGVLPADLSDAVAFFRSECWQIPGQTTSVPLIEE